MLWEIASSYSYFGQIALMTGPNQETKLMSVSPCNFDLFLAQFEYEDVVTDYGCWSLKLPVAMQQRSLKF